LLCGAKRRAVQLGLLRIARTKRELDLELRPAPIADKLDPAGLGAEANELCVIPRPRGEALRPDV
jgi:hypothetical protein